MPALRGHYAAPLKVSPSSLNFGKVTVGKTSSALTVTVTSLASESIGYSAAITGTGFAISSNPCNGTIGGGAKCSIGITFKAPSRGTFSGTLTLNNDLVNSPQTVSLTGTGK